VLEDISNTTIKNISITPKKLQRGKGMNYQPMNASIAVANIERVKSVVKVVDNEKVSPF